MDEPKQNLSEEEIKLIEKILFKDLSISKALFPEKDTKINVIPLKHIDDIINKRDKEIKEWWDLTKSGCYHRTFIIHPITKQPFVEFITKRTFDKKTCYIAKTAPILLDDSISSLHSEKKIKKVQLKVGMTQNILKYLALRGMVLEVAQQTEAL